VTGKFIALIMRIVSWLVYLFPNTSSYKHFISIAFCMSIIPNKVIKNKISNGLKLFSVLVSLSMYTYKKKMPFMKKC
jgi:hypothetical protein